MNNIKSGDSVLIVWSNSEPNEISNLVNQIQSIGNTSVVLENSSMIAEASRPLSSFDVILSNWIQPHSVSHSDSLLALLIKLLKPCGKIILKDTKDITLSLKLNGFINVTQDSDNLYVAEKPNFEVGSKASLKLGNKPDVWKLDDTVEEVWADAKDDEIIDSDMLLDEEDLKKPDQQSLRENDGVFLKMMQWTLEQALPPFAFCATTGKRKACADCSCGLAEELRGETKETPKSSCGSCYLGDAFRCATCPYLGMPAFKPGEKVLLDLKSDI